jgi:two-component system sensor histidine kinase RegB
MNGNVSALAPFALNLQRLCLIRIFVLLALTAATLYASLFLRLPLAYMVIYTTLGITAGATLLVLLRLQKPWPVTDIELFVHILLDLSSLSILIYYTGGASNPFVSYYLVPLSISAATLPWRFTWTIAIISIMCYTWMLFDYVPLDILAPHHHSSAFNPHLIGMWFTFTVSALLITYFVVKMAHTLRLRQQALNDAHEIAMHNEQVIGVATLAAGTAHKLGTPLSTMAVLLSELKQQLSGNSELTGDIDLLKEQLTLCKNTLNELSQTAQIHENAISRTPRPANTFTEEVIDRWRVIRPDAEFSSNIPEDSNVPLIETGPSLEHAIQNLLNNAADANPKSIEIDLSWNEQQVILKVKDFGPGIALDTAEKLGKPFFTTKMKGLGLGLFLSKATVNRYGGTIALYNHRDGGTLAEITLPIAVNHEQRT